MIKLIQKSLIKENVSENERSRILSAIELTSSNSLENKEAIKDTGAHWITGALILFNSTIGTGVLVFPLTIDHLGGFFNANIAHLLILAFVMPTMYTLVYCSERYDLNTYHEVLAVMCGKWAEKLVALTLVVGCYGISITFLILIGDQFDRIFLTFFGPEFCQHWYMNRKFTITLMTVLSIWPMTYSKQIYFLKYLMSFGTLTMIYLSFLVVYEFFKIDHTQVYLKTSPSNIYQFGTGITFLVVCYSSNEVVVQVSMCFKEYRTKNFTKSMILAMLMLFIFYTIPATIGYLTFGTKVASDLMKMYPSNDLVVIIGIIALIIKFTTSYAPFLFCARDTIQEIVFENSDDQESNAQFKVRIIVTTVLNLLILLPSILAPNLTTVLNFLGALVVFPVFVYPGSCIISISLNNYQVEDQVIWSTISMFIFALVLMILSAIVFVVALINAFDELGSVDKKELVCNLT